MRQVKLFRNRNENINTRIESVCTVLCACQILFSLTGCDRAVFVEVACERKLPLLHWIGQLHDSQGHPCSYGMRNNLHLFEIIYLFCLESYELKEKQREITFIHWLTSQTAITNHVGPGELRFRYFWWLTHMGSRGPNRWTSSCFPQPH